MGTGQVFIKKCYGYTDKDHTDPELYGPWFRNSREGKTAGKQRRETKKLTAALAEGENEADAYRI